MGITLHTLATYLHPAYHPKEEASGISYGFCSLTHATKKASLIRNTALRYIATLFALIFDAVLGAGIVLTPLYNAGSFLFNNSYARIRNFFIERRAIETGKHWNTTALKTWGVIAGIASIYLLYRLQMKSPAQKISVSSFLPNNFKHVTSFFTPNNIPLIVGALIPGLILVGKTVSWIIGKKDVDPTTGQVNALALSYLHSTLGKCYLAGLALLGIRLNLSFNTSFLNFLCTGIVSSLFLLGILKWRHRLLFDISSIYTVLTQREWWNQGHVDDVLVGAIPLEQHVETLKDLGVTHVISMLEPFEQEEGLLRPATQALWQKHRILFFSQSTQDFKGVPPVFISNVINYMKAEREKAKKKNDKILFYIHCKAGRGRSATIAVADGLTTKFEQNQNLFSRGVPILVREEILSLKAKRARINLARRQVIPIEQYCSNVLLPKRT